jgi:predicted acylesterase/phospholipase RssA
VNRSAIVVEGGAIRAIFAAGVLDGPADADFFPFDLAIGVSAGACTLASQLAGQRGRNQRVLCGPMTRPRFINVRLASRSVRRYPNLVRAIRERGADYALGMSLAGNAISRWGGIGLQCRRLLRACDRAAREIRPP